MLQQSTRFVILGLFGLSFVEKARVLKERRAAWHPLLIITAFRRDHAVALIKLGLAADMAVLVASVTRPGIGLLLAIPVVATYTVFGLMGRPSENRGGCGCFLGLVDTMTAPSLLIRNCALIGLVLLAISRPWVDPSLQSVDVALAGGALAMLAVIVRSIDRTLLDRRDASQTSRMVAATAADIGGDP